MAVPAKEQEMGNDKGASLRREIDKWFVRKPGAPVRVARTVLRNRRCVRVETIQEAKSFVIFFFQHDDRSWSVLPPPLTRPTMCAYRYAA